MRTTSLRIVAHPFQKWSSAPAKPDLGVSIHGHSSRNTTFLPGSFRDSSSSPSHRNASNQSAGAFFPLRPHLRSFSPNSRNCTFIEAPFTPECSKANR